MTNKTLTPNTTSDNKEAVVDKKMKTWNIIGIVLCVLMIPILIVNCTLLIKSLVSDDVPSIGGRIPLIVLTESMEPKIKGGDIIICHVPSEEDIQNLKKGDIISFFDPRGGTSVVTHQIYSDPYMKNGKLYFDTWGVNNVKPDGTPDTDNVPVPASKVVGIYHGTRIPFIGNVAMFMQSTWGLIICIFIPLAALLSFEFIHRKKQDKVKDSDIEALMAELQALKQAQADQSAGAEDKDATKPNE
ncbi:MAG: signal peptidase I [Clostridia bacterium]|nr:signal peptidase I [Clostridia bacterium]